MKKLLFLTVLSVISGLLVTQQIVDAKSNDPDPLQVHIDGPGQISMNEFVQFDADVDGGTPPYSYEWEQSYVSRNGPWSPVGSDIPYYTYISYSGQSFWLRLRVTDADQNSKLSLVHPVHVTP